MSGNPLINGNPMMNNPLFGLINMFRGGSDVSPFINQMKQKNPEFGEAIDSINGKDQNEINNFISQKAKERGVDLKQIADMIGMPANVRKIYGID